MLEPFATSAPILLNVGVPLPTAAPVGLKTSVGGGIGATAGPGSVETKLPNFKQSNTEPWQNPRFSFIFRGLE